MPRKFKEKKAEKFTYVKGKKVKVEEELKSDKKLKPDNKNQSNNESKKKD